MPGFAAAPVLGSVGRSVAAIAKGIHMEQEISVREDGVIATDLFGVQAEAPLQKQAPMQKHAPKTIFDGDIGTFGGRGGG